MSILLTITKWKVKLFFFVYTFFIVVYFLHLLRGWRTCFRSRTYYTTKTCFIFRNVRIDCTMTYEQERHSNYTSFSTIKDNRSNNSHGFTTWNFRMWTCLKQQRVFCLDEICLHIWQFPTTFCMLTGLKFEWISDIHPTKNATARFWHFKFQGLIKLFTISVL